MPTYLLRDLLHGCHDTKRYTRLHTWLRHRHVGRLIIVEGGEVQHQDARPRCVSQFNHNHTPRTVTIDETLGDEHCFLETRLRPRVCSYSTTIAQLSPETPWVRDKSS